MAGFSPAVKRLIIDRDNGLCCRCDRLGTDIHHRRPRGMGGTRRPDTDQPPNGVLLCRTCHVWVEANRADATAEGWLVGQSTDPATVPVWRHRSWWLLDDGGWTATDPTPPF